MRTASCSIHSRHTRVFIAAVACLCLVMFPVYQFKGHGQVAEVTKRTCNQYCSCMQESSTADKVNLTGNTTEGSTLGPSSEEPGSRTYSEPSSYNCSTPGLPDLVFVAGIEGSGHHAVLQLFYALRNEKGKNPYFVLDHYPHMHLLEPGYIRDAQRLGFAFIQKALLRERINYVVDQMTINQLQGGRGAFVGQNSFTMGFGIMSTARPDLLALSYFHCKLYNLKIIVTKRHPIPALFSAVRRFGFKYDQLDMKSARNKSKFLKEMSLENLKLEMHARVFEDQLIYLNQQLLKLQKEGSVLIYFFEMDNLLSNTTKQSELNSLADFLELSEQERISFWKAHLIPHKPFPLPPSCSSCMNRTLYDFFEERKEMWPILV